ncbi:MAG TPA: efflux RND transporter periplasmic adaptor subunit [Candidatus Acidoferrales bacterium]|nr:efflux RND transporter periplasmic adaptor subunit [Candidatus Acidoferrales bacterium]
MSDSGQTRLSSASGAPQPAPASPLKHGGLVFLVALLIVAGIVIGGVLPRVKARAALKAATNDLAIPTVSVAHPQLGAPQTEIVLPGNVQAFTDSPIYARTNGYLKKWYVDIGARVKANQLLAEIETPEIDQQLDQARADLNTAEANFALSKITADRYQDLLKTDSVSKQDVDNANGDFAAKKAMVASAQSNVKRLEELQSFEKIYAPFDGVITARNTDIGHLINSGAGAPATELFHIAAIQELRVYVNVPQQYSPSAKPGLTADLTLQELPGRRFRGTLVRTADSIDLATRTLLVEVDVDNRSGELLPGAYAEVHLKVPAGTPTLILPVSALIFRSDGLQVGTVENGNRAALKNVVLGHDLGSQVEVVSGLTPDDFVITNPPDSLVSGEIVRIATPDHSGQ